MLLEHKCGRGKPDRASRGFFSCFSGWHHAPSLGSLAASKRRHPPPLEPDSWRFCHLRYTNTHNEHTLLQTRRPPEIVHFPQGGKRILLVRLTPCAANDVAAPNQKSKEGGESDSGGGTEGGERERRRQGGGLCGGGLLLGGGDGLLGALSGVTGVTAELRVDLYAREAQFSDGQPLGDLQTDRELSRDSSRGMHVHHASKGNAASWAS